MGWTADDTTWTVDDTLNHTADGWVSGGGPIESLPVFTVIVPAERTNIVVRNTEG